MLHASPFIGAQMPAVLYAGVVVVLFTILAIWGLKNTRVASSLFFILVLPILNTVIRGDSFGDTRSIFFVFSGIMQKSIYPLLTWYVLKMDNIRFALFLFLFYYGVELVTYITSALATDINPLIVRLNPGDLRESDAMMYQMKKVLNVGNFDTVYGCLLLIPVCVIALKNRARISRNKLFGVLPILAIINSYNFLFKAQFTIAFFLGLLMLLLFFVPTKMSPSFFQENIYSRSSSTFRIQTFFAYISFKALIHDITVQSIKVHPKIKYFIRII